MFKIWSKTSIKNMEGHENRRESVHMPAFPQILQVAVVFWASVEGGEDGVWMNGNKMLPLKYKDVTEACVTVSGSSKTGTAPSPPRE